jgi:hypothetical protein
MEQAEDYILLKEELKLYVGLFDQASEIIRNEGVSNYPIMVVHKQELELGIPLPLDRPLNGGWGIHASTLEEFVSKNIIDDEQKIDEFRELYNRHENHVCLFTLTELGAQFIFFEKK